jgi:diketogulonate reductase-like aldo/keto reductase
VQYKTIGYIKVPSIGQGTQGIHDVEVIKRGISLGQTFIDTAEVYKNEEVVGEVIKGQRDKVQISTKFSPEHNGYDDVIKSCEASLKRLGTDYIDFYSMHWPNPNFDIENTLSALTNLQVQGKVKNIGICNATHKQIEGFGLDFIQNEYNLFDRGAEEVFGHCEKHNILFVAYSPFQHFYSLNPDSMIWLQEIAFKYQRPLTQITLNWIISHKNVIAIPKTKNPEHQISNSQASDFTITTEEIKKIDELFPYKVEYIDPKLIKISKVGKFPQTLEEAKKNLYNFVPSPLELSENLDEIKPVRVERRKAEFELIEGGLRYWAWVIKNGDKLIPALIREDWII